MLPIVSTYCATHNVDCRVDYDRFWKRWNFRGDGDDDDFSISNEGVVERYWCYQSFTEANEYYHGERIAIVDRYLLAKGAEAIADYQQLWDSLSAEYKTRGNDD